jgi:hypothetical protein
MMMDLCPKDRTAFYNLLVDEYDPKKADGILELYLQNKAKNCPTQDYVIDVIDENDLKYWKYVHSRQRSHQKERSASNKHMDVDIWDEDEMMAELKNFDSCCVVTGIVHYSLSPRINRLNWNRIWDQDGRYCVGETVPTLIHVNFALAAHPALKNKKALQEYIRVLELPDDTNHMIAMVRAIRPFFDSLVTTQKRKLRGSDGSLYSRPPQRLKLIAQESTTQEGSSHVAHSILKHSSTPADESHDVVHWKDKSLTDSWVLENRISSSASAPAPVIDNSSSPIVQGKVNIYFADERHKSLTPFIDR